MQEDSQKLLERLQQIADQPESFDDRMRRMNELYETNSFHPPVKEDGRSETED